jgi:hypothetical protein
MVFSTRRGRLAALSVSLCVCLLPVSAFAQDGTRSALRLPTIVAGAAAAADWATTYHALTNYHVREVNPLLQPFASSPGQLVSVGAAMDVGGLAAWNLMVGPTHPRMAVAGLWAMAAFRSYLALHNLRNEQRAARR